MVGALERDKNNGVGSFLLYKMFSLGFLTVHVSSIENAAFELYTLQFRRL